MGKMEFTPAQQDSIDASGGAIIVSAAAGSGKTRVLVQRVIKMLTNEENPIYADKLLVVTFTKAAAEEMKKRIITEIEELIKNQPDNIHLHRQQILLPSADICTIHSFCSRIIRENFFSLDINQDFRIAEDNELSVIKYRIMSDIIEEKYAERSSGFMMLSAILSGVKNDKNLENSLLNVYAKSTSHPDIDEWLDNSAELYNPCIPLSETIFAEIAYNYLDSSIKYFEMMLETAENIIYENESVFCTKNPTCGENKLKSLQKFVSELSKFTEEKNWNNISKHIMSFTKQSYRSPTGKKKDLVSYQEIQSVKVSFDNIDKEIEEKLKPIFGTTEEVYKSDTEQIYPAVCCMCDIIKEFSKRFFEEKKEKGILDFADLEHLTLNLLKGNSKNQKSELAKSTSEKYDVIMIDEFQDTNEIQDYIFRYVSKDEKNMFVVGDIKQSIYRFREAMPEIFKNRRNKSVMYNKENAQFPACIILDKNFRSRQGIIDTVNFVFGAIMSEYVGEIEYNQNEMLTAGAVYPEIDSPETEIHTLNIYQEDVSETENKSKYEKEAIYIAQTIRKMIDNGEQVTENGTLRPARYSDFCVLMRYMKSHSQEYSDIMNNFGIPTYIDKPYSLFGCYEVNIVLSLLKIVDNRLQDIPLLAVMLCPVFGFTPDDLAYLKTEYNKCKHIYSRILLCSGIEFNEKDEQPEDNKETNIPLKEKCINFIKDIGYLRTLSVTLSVSALTDAFFEKTGYISVISAMSNGDIRVKNIRKLMSFIRDYENGGKSSLSDFVRHISHLEENGTDISIGDTAPEDSVKIMSIHHSKGLEFPICIMAGMNSSGQNVPPDVYCHKTLGFGMKMLESKTMFKYSTFQRNIIARLAEREELSEAMRILYVAMTRAREKLIAVITIDSKKSDGFRKKLQEIASLVKINNGKIEPHCVEKGKSLGDWILMCALVHPSMSELREEADIEDIMSISSKSKWKYVKGYIENKIIENEIHKEAKTEPDKKLLALLKKRFSEQYRYKSRVAIPAKISASALTHNEYDSYNIAVSQPAFMQESKMTGVEKGTAIHNFLQYADFSKLGENIDEEKSRLLNSGKISKEQYNSINEDDIRAFTQSETYKSIINAEKIYREYRFTVNISAKEIDKSYNENENVILQGAMDCIVCDCDGIIIIDYKTDKVSYISDLKRRYKKQLDLYKNAAEQIFDLPVKKCLIYSIKLGEEIEV